jgi:5-methylcytosine-specific restriction endonuclease McrA
MFNNSKKILATITWMFSLLPREAFQDPHPTVPICVIYGDHKMLQLSIYLTAICIRNMQSRHASVSSCFWHKTELLPCQKDVFFSAGPLMFFLWSVSHSQMQSMQIRYVSPFIGHHESRSNVELDCIRMAHLSEWKKLMFPPVLMPPPIWLWDEFSCSVRWALPYMSSSKNALKSYKMN